MNWIKEQRERKGVTQEQLASDLGFSRTLVTKWETGKATVTMENTRRLCEYFEIDVEEILKPRYVQAVIDKRRKDAKVGIVLDLLMIICTIVMISTVIYKIAGNKSFDWSEYLFCALIPINASLSGYLLHKDYLLLKDDRSLLIAFLSNKTNGKERKELYSLTNAQLRTKIVAFNK